MLAYTKPKAAEQLSSTSSLCALGSWAWQWHEPGASKIVHVAKLS